MLIGELTQTIRAAHDIPYPTADEACSLLQTEFARFMSLIKALDPDDWAKPTACTAWTVQNMLAHQAGGYASGTGYREMIRQYSAKRKPGQLPEDATNELQVSERAGRSPADLIAELNTVGPVAIQKWAYQFRLAKLVTELVKVPHPVAGVLSFKHLMWVIHSRDTWMHRLDICRATGRHFEQTAEHDGRIAALVMLDVERALSKLLDGNAIVFELTGIAGGNWKVGGGEPVAQVKMDTLDFNIFVSGRFSFEEAIPRAEISGDRALTERVLKDLLILY
jgi:uncharacterized protein (TIGR03083 family)